MAETFRQGYTLLRLLPQALDIERVLAEMLPGRGQFDPRMTTFEQDPAEAVFHRLDARADGRLGHVQVFGGAVEIPAVGNFQEGADVIDFQDRLPLAGYRISR